MISYLVFAALIVLGILGVLFALLVLWWRTPRVLRVPPPSWDWLDYPD